MESSSEKLSVAEEDAIVDSVVNSFALTDETLEEVVRLLSAEMNKGLDAQTHDSADVKMFPTFVTGIPDGTEKGDYLAIDFGRSNFRILWVHLPGIFDNAGEGGDSDGVMSQAGSPVVRSRIFVVSPPMMTGPGIELFDFIAKSLAFFMEKEGLSGRKLSLCFIFAFPVRQESLDSGRLVKWTKGYACSGVEGRDVVQLFHDALERSVNPGVKGVRCVALIDDATGTMMACGHAHSDCLIGAIFGTGTNACYMESASKVGTWTNPTSSSSSINASASSSSSNNADKHVAENVIVNTSWGYFGANGCLDFLRTEFDKENDARSSRPGECVYEKLIAGHYLGEIVRLALIKLHSLGIVFKDSAAFGTSLMPPFPFINASPGMSRSPSSVSLGADERAMKDCDDDDSLPLFLHPERRRSFHTKYLTEVDGGAQGGGEELPVMKQILAECGVTNASGKECEIVKKICQAVSTRAARLSAAGIVALLDRISVPRVTIGVDGSLFKFHSRFHDQLKTKIGQLCAGRNVKAELVLADDGNSRGAALVAAVAERMEAGKKELQEPMQI